jgi:hypothetical protein
MFRVYKVTDVLRGLDGFDEFGDESFFSIEGDVFYGFKSVEAVIAIRATAATTNAPFGGCPRITDISVILPALGTDKTFGYACHYSSLFNSAVSDLNRRIFFQAGTLA